MKNKLILFISILLFVNNYLFAATDIKPRKCENGRYGFVDASGKQVFPCKFDMVGKSVEGMAIVKVEYKYGYVNTQTAQEFPCEYDKASDFFDGLAWVKSGGKYKYINKTGKVVTTVVGNYDEVENFFDGVAKVHLNDKIGFIDKTGKEIIPCKYKVAYVFSQGLSAVQCEDGYFGFIDKKGKEVIPCKYGLAAPFKDGLAEVTTDFEEKFYIDKKENRYETKNDFIYYFSDFSKKYVGEKMIEWQKKGEFEKSSTYQKRVNAATRKTKNTSLIKEAEQKYLDMESASISIDEFSLGEYNADKEAFIVNSWRYGNVSVPVPLADAPFVKSNWDKIKKTPQYAVKNDKIVVAKILITIPKNEKKQALKEKKSHKEKPQEKTTSKKVSKKSQEKSSKRKK
ncbi:hypothetical protein FACS189456_0990 [Bacteroidia bacterium]|nr:hypothetical protein FACS189456_0990 [Bacteroidia bacterium]